METRTVPLGESEGLSVWLALAAPDPALAPELWRQQPHLPRILRCGISFDVVLADRGLVALAYEILHGYGQLLGPALIFDPLYNGAVLVPPGTTTRWSELIAASPWPDDIRRPACLGLGHTIRVPPVESASTSSVRWLQAPDTDMSIGPGPLLTSPAQLARCLAEAHSLRPTATSLSLRNSAAGMVRTVLRTPQGT